MPKLCAFLTMEDPAGFFIYDHLAVAPLQELGWDVEEIPWSRPKGAWGRFRAVVIRSTWDYQNAAAAFMNTLAEIERSGAQLFNPLAVCKWNLDKTYLADLARRQVPIVPTLWLDRLEAPRIPELFSASNRSRVVAKPLVGANADDTYLLHRARPETWDAALRVFAEKRLMVQPFLEAVAREGEYSLFYFAGRYSHAILKKPRAGDFRVQEEHGGIIRRCDPAPAIRHVADHAIDALEQRLLYARVDIVNRNDATPAVMELELIEPSLYFNYDDGAARRFADALAEMTR